MMEEVFTMMAYDAQAVEQMSEQEILACLGAETGPTFTVPSKKAKLKKGRLQIMEDEEDPLDKYLTVLWPRQKENRRLQEASLRLEQENDSLAHRLISSKVALRNALDTAEDRVDELAKDLLQSMQQLQASEEERRRKEEEAATLKQVFRRELEKSEQEVKRSAVIVADYKQICAQLTKRLEQQQAAYRDEIDSLKRAVEACPRCRRAAGAERPSTPESEVTEPGREEDGTGPRPERDRERESVRAQIRELEQELAQTKLQMVEANCKIQELEHQKGVLANELNEAKNSWISKAFTSLRTSTKGLSSPRDGAPAAGRSRHAAPLSGWRTKRLWPHRDKEEDADLDA
ncbi:rab GTPase-activating protein 1-like isoform X2 [Betta splendens]|uniref:Rab GTPase-activating protein 1-like isoform X2 n=1 Tax=Betta splendens TaxID=158456 RepID=A0A9W2XJM3_BETSP|nr:rab GTPase-activating protein 1-like isoform X2 [Betta splendens]